LGRSQAGRSYARGCAGGLKARLSGLKARLSGLKARLSGLKARPCRVAVEAKEKPGKPGFSDLRKEKIGL
jgi:hypothetical protein